MSDNFPEISSALVDQISRQTDLITSLSVAAIGAIFALFLQVALHNKNSQATKIALNSSSIILFAVGFFTLSVLFGYLVNGALTEAIPFIFRDASPDKSFGSLSFAGHREMSIFASLQFFSFLLGIICLIICGYLNGNLIE